MDHKGWFTVIQSGLILESSLLPGVCVCACGCMYDAFVWIHGRLCVCICVLFSCLIEGWHVPRCYAGTLLMDIYPVLLSGGLLTGLLFSLHPSPFIFYLEHFLGSKGAHIFCSGVGSVCLSSAKGHHGVTQRTF